MFSSAIPRTVAYQVLLSMGFSRQEYWSGLPFPSPGDLPDPGTKPRSPALQADALPSEPQEKPTTPRWNTIYVTIQTYTLKKQEFHITFLISTHFLFFSYSFSYILCNLFLFFFFLLNAGHNQLNKLHNLLKGHNWQLENAAPAPMVSLLLNSNRNYFKLCSHLGFPGGSVGKESACNAGDADSILGTGRFPGGWHGNPL